MSSKLLRPPTPPAIETNTHPGMCTRCGAEPQAGGGNDYWCLKCRAEYQRNYRSADAIRARAEGFAAGVAAIRTTLEQRFTQVGSGVYMGHEVAALIKREPAPLPD